MVAVLEIFSALKSPVGFSSSIGGCSAWCEAWPQAEKVRLIKIVWMKWRIGSFSILGESVIYVDCVKKISREVVVRSSEGFRKDGFAVLKGKVGGGKKQYAAMKKAACIW